MSLAWSPDGSLIAFTRAVEEDPRRAHIYLMQANGSGQMQITNTLASDWNPVWQPLPPVQNVPFALFPLWALRLMRRHRHIW